MIKLNFKEINYWSIIIQMLTKIKHQYQFVIVPFCLCKINLCFHLWKLTYFHYLKSYSILWEMALLQASLFIVLPLYHWVCICKHETYIKTFFINHEKGPKDQYNMIRWIHNEIHWHFYARFWFFNSKTLCECLV